MLIPAPIVRGWWSGLPLKSITYARSKTVERMPRRIWQSGVTCATGGKSAMNNSGGGRGGPAAQNPPLSKTSGFPAYKCLGVIERSGNFLYPLFGNRNYSGKVNNGKARPAGYSAGSQDP